MKRNGEKLTITAPGIQKRNFTHVSDTVAALELVGLYGDSEYCIGSKEAYSIIEIADMLKMEWEFTPEKRGNRMAASIDTTNIEALGWSPKHNLKDYLKNQ